MSIYKVNDARHRVTAIALAVGQDHIAYEFKLKAALVTMVLSTFA